MKYIYIVIYNWEMSPLYINTHDSDIDMRKMLSIDMLTIYVPDKKNHPQLKPKIEYSSVMLPDNGATARWAGVSGIDVHLYTVSYPFYFTKVEGELRWGYNYFIFECILVNNMFAFLKNIQSHYQSDENNKMFEIIYLLKYNFRLNQVLDAIEYIFSGGVKNIAYYIFDSWEKTEVEQAIKYRARVEAEKQITEKYYQKYGEQIYKEPLKNTVEKKIEKLAEKIYNKIIIEEYEKIKDKIVESIDAKNIKKQINKLLVNEYAYYVFRNHRIKDRIMKTIVISGKNNIKGYTRMVNFAISLTHYAMPIKLWKVNNDWLKITFNIRGLSSQKYTSLYNLSVTYEIKPSDIIIDLCNDSMKNVLNYNVISFLIKSIREVYELMKKTNGHFFAKYIEDAAYLIFTLSI